MKSHHADPAACRVCARTRAPDGQPCKRHGGPTRSTSFRGNATDENLRDKDDRYLKRAEP